VIKKKERNEENKILKEILLLPSPEKEKKHTKNFNRGDFYTQQLLAPFHR